MDLRGAYRAPTLDDEEPPAPPPPEPQDDMLTRAKALLSRMDQPRTATTLPPLVHPDPQAIQDALSRAHTLGIVKTALGSTPSWNQARLGHSPMIKNDTSGLDAMQQQALAPIATQQHYADAQNKQNLEQAKLTQGDEKIGNAASLGEMKGLLSGYTNQQRLGQADRRLDQGDDRNATYRDRTDSLIGAEKRRAAQAEKALLLRGVKYNPNTGKFENIAGSAAGAATATPTGASADGAEATRPQGSPAPGSPPGSPAPQAAPSFPPMTGKLRDKALKELGADFDPSGGRQGEFGKNQARVNAANRLKALGMGPDGKPRDLNPQQMPELSQALASLIAGGGQGTLAQIQHLTPSTMSGDAAKIAQWVTNEPHGAGQRAFVKNMLETAQREAEQAQTAIDQTRHQRGAKHQAILRGNPEDARAVLNGFGWDLGPDGLPMIKPPAAFDPNSFKSKMKGAQ